jgi:hypothetical protein
MDDDAKADILIRTENLFKFIQFFDELLENDDAKAKDIAERFYCKKTPITLQEAKTWKLLPFMQLQTTLAILNIFFLYIKSNDNLKNGICKHLNFDYNITTIPESDKNSIEIEQVLKTMRNAMAHYTENFKDKDNLVDNVTFDNNCIVKFSSKTSQYKTVCFCKDEGFVRFVGDYIKAIMKDQK